MRPTDSEFAPFYASYIARVTETDPLPVLEAQPAELRALADRITPEDEVYRYAIGKWSVRQVVGHMIDTERVMGYRAFCIARGEAKPLPGFDEKEYVAHADSDERPVKELAHQSRRCAMRISGRCGGGRRKIGTASATQTASPCRPARSRTSWQAMCVITWRCYGSGTVSSRSG